MSATCVCNFFQDIFFLGGLRGGRCQHVLFRKCCLYQNDRLCAQSIIGRGPVGSSLNNISFKTA